MSTPNQPNPESDQASKGLIMVVEDEEHIREAVHEFLEEQHYKVISVENGEQALAALHTCSHLPDLMLTDMWVRDMNCVELALEVRKEPAWLPISFIFMHGGRCGGRSDRQDYFSPWTKNPLDAWLLKPFNADQLLSAVEEVLARRRASS